MIWGKVMYKIGEYISHPLHGAGIIENVETRRINGEDKYYYVLKISSSSMVVMVPVDTCSDIGVRPIVDRAVAVNVLDSFSAIDIDMTQNWNRRYRENMLRLKSGDLYEVARVIKGLMLREAEKGLSTGERKMLRSAKQILISEIALSAELEAVEIETRLNSVFI